MRLHKSRAGAPDSGWVSQKREKAAKLQKKLAAQARLLGMYYYSHDLALAMTEAANPNAKQSRYRASYLPDADKTGNVILCHDNGMDGNELRAIARQPTIIARQVMKGRGGTVININPDEEGFERLKTEGTPEALSGERNIQILQARFMRMVRLKTLLYDGYLLKEVAGLSSKIGFIERVSKGNAPYYALDHEPGALGRPPSTFKAFLGAGTFTLGGIAVWTTIGMGSPTATKGLMAGIAVALIGALWAGIEYMREKSAYMRDVRKIADSASTELDRIYVAVSRESRALRTLLKETNKLVSSLRRHTEEGAGKAN
jgi:hypothetical protein